jgi:predicted DCC family thiol-disulfide oxidoreductase YuxK
VTEADGLDAGDRKPVRLDLQSLWLRLDLRSLGLFRILMGLLLIVDWRLRWADLDAFYSETGVLPAGLARALATSPYQLSILDHVEAPWAVRAVFGLGLACEIALLLGLRTRLAQVLVLVFFASVANRNAMIFHGGDAVLLTMLVWTAFLPLGARFSVDALRRALRDGVEPRAAIETRPQPPIHGPASLASLAVLLEIGLIYFLTALAKSGETWRNGTAVYYALQLDQYATPFGRWLGEQPIAVSRLLTWGTLGLEFAVLPLVMLPWGQPWLRRAAVVGLTVMHLGTWATLELGPFPFVMIATFVLLLGRRDWAAFGRWAGRGLPAVTAYYDDACGFCHRVAQLVTLADRAGRVHFVGGSEAAASDPSAPPEMAETLVVVEAASGRKRLRAAAVAALAAALPRPWWPLRILAWPGLAAPADRLYDVVARNRRRISRGLGLAECGLRPAGRGANGDGAAPGGRRRWARPGLEALAGLVLVAVVVDVHNLNFATRFGLPRLPQPAWMQAIVQAPQLHNEWRMFAPDPFRYDGWWVVDAVTTRGERVDPLTGRKPTFDKPADLAARYDVFWHKYLISVCLDRWAATRAHLGRWLARNSERRGFGHLERFDFYYVLETTLPPGTPKPWPSRALRVWAWEGRAGSAATPLPELLAPPPGAGTP